MAQQFDRKRKTKKVVQSFREYNPSSRNEMRTSEEKLQANGPFFSTHRSVSFFSSLGVLRSERTLDRFFLSSNDGQTCPHSLCLPLLGPLSRLQKSRTKAAEEKGRVEILKPLERAFFPLRFSFHSREVKRKERRTRDNTVNAVIDEPAVDVRLCPFGFSLFFLFLLINHSR